MKNKLKGYPMKNKGFTLIEMMIVTAIVCTLVVVVSAAVPLLGEHIQAFFHTF